MHLVLFLPVALDCSKNALFGGVCGVSGGCRGSVWGLSGGADIIPVWCNVLYISDTTQWGWYWCFWSLLGHFWAFLPGEGFSVTIRALVGGVGHTYELIHPILNVSLGNWGGFGEYGKHQIRYKQQETQKPVFALSGKKSVTWVALVGGIGDPPHQNHIV